MECGKSLEKILQDGELKESLISISHDNSVNEENTAYFNLSLHSQVQNCFNVRVKLGQNILDLEKLEDDNTYRFQIKTDNLISDYQCYISRGSLKCENIVVLEHVDGGQIDQFYDLGYSQDQFIFTKGNTYTKLAPECGTIASEVDLCYIYREKTLCGVNILESFIMIEIEDKPTLRFMVTDEFYMKYYIQVLDIQSSNQELKYEILNIDAQNKGHVDIAIQFTENYGNTLFKITYLLQENKPENAIVDKIVSAENLCLKVEKQTVLSILPDVPLDVFKDFLQVTGKDQEDDKIGEIEQQNQTEQQKQLQQGQFYATKYVEYQKSGAFEFVFMLCSIIVVMAMVQIVVAFYWRKKYVDDRILVKKFGEFKEHAKKENSLQKQKSLNDNYSEQQEQQQNQEDDVISIKTINLQ